MKLKKYEIENQVAFLPLQNVERGLGKPAIQRWAYILHDKDVREDGTLKEPHYHVLVWLKYSQESKHVAEWFGVQEQFVERVKSDVGALEYLTHANAPEKYQYDASDVVSSFDMQKAIETEKRRISDNARKDEIITGIDEGTIREYNLYEHISITEYDRFKKSIENAFAFRKMRMKGVERKMECVYIVGESGCGKTTYAKEIAKGKEYSVYVSSGSNDVLDDYRGEDCIILDDLRPSTLGLADLLKMLDNNTASSVKSRYKNKVLECRMIIITTTLEIDSFFSQVFKDEQESAIQLMRRCQTMIRMNNREMVFYAWSDKRREYDELVTLPNVVLEGFKVRDKSPEEQLEHVAHVLNLGADMVLLAKKKMAEKKAKDDSENPFI